MARIFSQVFFLLTFAFPPFHFKATPFFSKCYKESSDWAPSLPFHICVFFSQSLRAVDTFPLLHLSWLNVNPSFFFPAQEQYNGRNFSAEPIALPSYSETLIGTPLFRTLNFNFCPPFFSALRTACSRFPCPQGQRSLFSFSHSVGIIHALRPPPQNDLSV